jgi:GDP-L-fucose synthase
MDFKQKRTFVAGSGGMVGGAIVRRLQSGDWTNLITTSSSKLDLRDQKQVELFFSRNKPEVVVLAAAKVGGILANNVFRADFIYDNLMIEANVINASYKHQVEKLIFLGSSCIYPRDCPQPILEEYLLTGPLEQTNEPYAVAKIAGLKLCESYYNQHGCNFYSLMPTNLYGPGDNFDLQSSHVVPALIRKFHEAKKQNDNVVSVWGTGRPQREFLYVDDAADAVSVFLETVEASEIYSAGVSHINVGSGIDLSISELAETIKDVVGFPGQIVFDADKPDGTPRKLLSVKRAGDLGWKFSTDLRDGLELAYKWFLNSSYF